MSSINLTWSADGNIDSYNVYRSETPMSANSLPEPLATGITTKSYSDISVTSGIKYYYRVASLANGISRLSSEISVSASNLAALSLVVGSARNAGVSGSITTLSLEVAPHSISDIILVVVRTFNTPSIPGFTKIYNPGNGFSVFAKIASTASASNTTETITMGYGGAASFILRPSHAVSLVNCDGVLSTYTSPAVANDTVVRSLSTPAATNDKSEIFELDALHWSAISSSPTPVSTITTDQAIIATRTQPGTVGDGFNFVLAGKARSSVANLAGATFNMTKIPPNAQTINAATMRIYAV